MSTLPYITLFWDFHGEIRWVAEPRQCLFRDARPVSMLLVDTSMWVDHFKKGSSALTPFLLEGKVLTHQFILGELSLGHFNKKDRDIIFDRLSALDVVPTLE